DLADREGLEARAGQRRRDREAAEVVERPFADLDRSLTEDRRGGQARARSPAGSDHRQHVVHGRESGRSGNGDSLEARDELGDREAPTGGRTRTVRTTPS